MTPHAPKQDHRPLAALAFKMPFMIDCVAFENFITAYFNDDLSFRQKLVFNIHLKMCRECREYLKAYESTILLARAQADVPYAEMDLGEVPEDLIKAVIEAATEK
ncbi:MAG: zf-HC2 domain-containing protein [Paracoccaceae bacterium]